MPTEKPDFQMSSAMERMFSYPAPRVQDNELFTQFKYTRLQGFDYSEGDGTVSRRDPSRPILVDGTYYIWYTKRHTKVPPIGWDRAGEASDEVPSTDWDLCDLWYATSKDGIGWEEQGIAVARPPKPAPGWRSVCTPDILVWKGKYYLYYQAFVEPSGLRGDWCPVSVSYADSPDGPWIHGGDSVIPFGKKGEWDQDATHDPHPIVYKGKIYLYYKAAYNKWPDIRDKYAVAHGLAIAEDPLGPFTKHPLNPVLNSGHETTYFPFKEGVAALAIKDGNERETMQYSKDGIHFEIASSLSLTPTAAAPYVPDIFTNTDYGRGFTWGLCHFINAGSSEKRYSIMARFDCDLSLDFHDPIFKQTGVWHKPEVYFQQGYRRPKHHPKEGNIQEEVLIPRQANEYEWIYKPAGDYFFGPDTKNLKEGEWYEQWVPNDHTFVKGEDGLWHIFGITHPLVETDPLQEGIHEGEFASFHAISSASEFKKTLDHHHYTDLPKVLPPSERPGEILANHAPYIVKKEGIYHMVYGHSPIRLAVSPDLLTWNPKGNLFLETEKSRKADQLLNDARDPNLLYHQGKYYIVYCSSRSVRLRESKDLIRWSDSHTIFKTETFDPESPSLIFHDGTFYLFVCSWDGIWDQKEIVGAYQHQTYVLQSNDPFNFGTDQEMQVATLNAHAPEIFQDEEGQWYISSVEWPNRGVSVDKLEWVKK